MIGFAIWRLHFQHINQFYRISWTYFLAKAHRNILETINLYKHNSVIHGFTSGGLSVSSYHMGLSKYNKILTNSVGSPTCHPNEFYLTVGIVDMDQKMSSYPSQNPPLSKKFEWWNNLGCIFQLFFFINSLVPFFQSKEMPCPFIVVAYYLTCTFLSFGYSISHVGPMCESSPASSGSERSKTDDSRFVLLYFWVSVWGGWEIVRNTRQPRIEYQFDEALLSQALASNRLLQACSLPSAVKFT